MAEPRVVSGKILRREPVEDGLAPGESLHIKKQGGKVFELRRVDGGPRSITADLAALFAEMPPEGSRSKVNLSGIIVEDRE